MKTIKNMVTTTLFCALISSPMLLKAHGGHDDNNDFNPMKIYDHKSNMSLDPLTGALLNNHPKNNPSFYGQGTDGGHNWRETERKARVRSATGALREFGEGAEQGDNFGGTTYINGDWLFVSSRGESIPAANTNAALSDNPLADDEELLAPKTPIESIKMGAVYIYKRDGNKWVFQQKLSGAEAKYVDPVLPITNNNNTGPFLANKNHGIAHQWGMSPSTVFTVNPDGGLILNIGRTVRGPGTLRRDGNNLFIEVSSVYQQPSSFTDGVNTIPTNFNTVLVYKLKGKGNSERWEFSQMLLEPKVSNYDGGSFGGAMAIKGPWAIITAQRADRASGPLKSFDPQHPLLDPDDTGVEGEDVGIVSLWKEDHNGIWHVVQNSISSPRGDLRLNAFGSQIVFDGQKALIAEQAGDFAEGLRAWNGKIHEFKLAGNKLVYTGNTLSQLDEPNSVVLTPNSFSWGFGGDYDTDGDYIAVGATGTGFIGDFKGLPGYVMIYKRKGNQINFLETLRATDDVGSRAHRFGSSIEMKDGYLFVGDSDRDNVAGANTREGRIYVFKREGNHYVEVNQLFHPNNVPYQGFSNDLIVNKSLKKGDIELSSGSGSAAGHIGVERSDSIRRPQPGSVTVLKKDD